MKKISARLLSVLLALTLILTVTACGQKPQPDDGSTPVSDISTTTTTTGDVSVDNTTEDVSADTTTGDASVDNTTEDVSADTTTGTQGTTKPSTTTKAPSTSATSPTKPTKPTKPSTSTTTSSKVTTTTESTTTTTTTKTTVPTQDPEFKSIKILSMGHSFSKDAMEKYLWDMFKAAGYDEIILAFMYIGGCPLEKHWVNVQQNRADYEYFKNTNGKWNMKPNIAPKFAITDEDWDYVTFQPSPDYGGGPDLCEGINDYDAFDDLVAWVGYSATNPNVQVHYHLTWAFATDCRLWCFTEYHNHDQMKHYRDLIAATKKYILPNEEVKGVIPCISSIQNARTSFLGDTFNMPGNYDINGDGYHLNDQGDYVASLTWFAYFSGQPASSMTFVPDQYKEAFPAMAEAVDNALKNPFQVTESSYK